MTKAANAIKSKVDRATIRADFPILDTEVNGKPLAYLDNAASSQMPVQVADRIDRYHRLEHANVHRGIHTLSQKATDAYEATRNKARDFINASEKDEIIFTTGTTDSINLVANSFGRLHFTQDDEILISEMEHHANIVPWQMIAEETGAVIRVIPVNDRGEIDLNVYEEMFSERTKMVAFVHVSNALGTINPVKQMTEIAHRHDAVVLIDGAQAVPHKPVDVQQIGCDFYAFSAHKMYGPTGFGILYGKRQYLEEMPPYRGGGDMIDKVTFEKTTYNVIPHRFEAGTPPISAAIGMGAAIDYLNEIGMESVAGMEDEIVRYALERVADVEGFEMIGNPEHRTSVIPFNLKGIHSQDVGMILDKQGIAIRTGHHCAQPILDRFNVTATARLSIAFYNNRKDIDRFIDGLNYVNEFFR